MKSITGDDKKFISKLILRNYVVRTGLIFLQDFHTSNNDTDIVRKISELLYSIHSFSNFIGDGHALYVKDKYVASGHKISFLPNKNKETLEILYKDILEIIDELEGKGVTIKNDLGDLFN